MEERPSRRRFESLTCTWTMRSPNSVMNAAESRNWCSRWLGSKLMPNARAVADRRQRLARRDEVVGDLRGVHLEREPHALGLEDVDDRPPALGELLVAALDRGEVVGRERVEEVPDRRAGEPGDHGDAELRGRPGRVLHPLGRAPAHALRIAVAPHLRRHDAPVALVDRVAHRLPDQMVADRPARRARAARADRAAARAVARVAQRLGDVEVIAPAGQLEPVEAPPAALLRERLERQVGPLAGEQGDGSAHGFLPGDVGHAVHRAGTVVVGGRGCRPGRRVARPQRRSQRSLQLRPSRRARRTVAALRIRSAIADPCSGSSRGLGGGDGEHDGALVDARHLGRVDEAAAVRGVSITMPSKMCSRALSSTRRTVPTCSPSDERTGVPRRSTL